MFNLSGTELVFIAMLGLIVLGPEKLPSAMRRAGKVYREIRNISSKRNCYKYNCFVWQTN